MKSEARKQIFIFMKIIPHIFQKIKIFKNMKENVISKHAYKKAEQKLKLFFK